MTAEDPIGLVSVFFNFTSCRRRVENWYRFYDGMKRHWHNLLIIELALDEDDFLLPSDLPNLLRFRTKSVLWHKESLINIGFAHLSEVGYAALGWLDADVLFRTDDWYEKTAETLQTKKLCQPFSHCVRLWSDGTCQISPSVTNALYRERRIQYASNGVGLAWVMRTEVWEGCKLFDYAIVGGGDEIMWRGLFAKYLAPSCVFKSDDSSNLMKAYRDPWCSRWSETVALSIGCPEKIQVTALAHGTAARREYAERWNILSHNHFDAHHHLQRAESGLLEWSVHTPPTLPQEIIQYFTRRDDSPQHQFKTVLH